MPKRRNEWWLPGLYRDEAGYYRFGGEMTGEEFETALLHVGRNDGPALLYDLHFAGSISVAENPGIVTTAWAMAEFPSNLLEEDTWVELFEEAGYTVDGQPAQRPEAPVTVYRGCHPARRFGMSWTTDLERAQWFADRDLGRGVGAVYEATVPTGWLLAYIHGSQRGEAEFVVDAIALNDETVKLVRTPPPPEG